MSFSIQTSTPSRCETKKLFLLFYRLSLLCTLALFALFYSTHRDLEKKEGGWMGYIHLPKSPDIINHSPRMIRAIATKAVAVSTPEIGLNLSLIHISEPTRRTPISYAVFC